MFPRSQRKPPKCKTIPGNSTSVCGLFFRIESPAGTSWSSRFCSEFLSKEKSKRWKNNNRKGRNEDEVDSHLIHHFVRFVFLLELALSSLRRENGRLFRNVLMSLRVFVCVRDFECVSIAPKTHLEKRGAHRYFTPSRGSVLRPGEPRFDVVCVRLFSTSTWHRETLRVSDFLDPTGTRWKRWLLNGLE